MLRISCVLLAGALLAPSLVRAADAPAGTWKFTVPGSNLTFLFTLEEKGGKWSGQFLGTNVPNFPKVTVGDVASSPDALRFSLKFQGQELSFDGKMPPEKSGRVNGSLQVGGGRMFLAALEPSRLTKYDPFEFNREVVEQSSDAQAISEAAVELLKLAGEKSAKIEEVRGWADKAYRAASDHGTRWQRSIAIRLAQALAGQQDFAALAVEYARRTERLLDDSDEAAVQMDVLEAIVQVMQRAGKAEDAKEAQGRLVKLEERDLAEYIRKLPFKPEPFAGRKAQSERTVLVELFTGAECPPCVAADLAFDALGKTYKPGEVVLLQYHLHIPGPDPLTNPDAMGRMQYYGRKIEGTPTIFFNGKPGAPGGGGLAGAKGKYEQYREVIEPLLEKEAEAKIQLTATRSESDISIKAAVSDIARTGDSIRLRFVLTEDHVRYTGGNNLRYHHCVVRAMPGGPRGLPMKDKAGEYTAKANLDDLRGRLNEYLDEYAKAEEEFPKPDRPMNLKGLRVVALIQDDDTNEILQAVQVSVKD